MAPPRRAPAKAAAKGNAAKSVVGNAADLPENRFLPNKEAVLFKLVLQHYEQKQWKKGVKAADQILEKYPNHGETLAMKGLFLTCLDQKDEGYALVKQGVKNDMQSHIVWHVYGLMHRADKNYEEALKCYSQANRIEKDSINILTDLATLAVQLRNHPQHVEARVNILRIAPRFRRHWIGLAVAYFAARMYYEADRLLRNYEEMLREVPDDEYDLSEILLFHATVLEAAGKFEECLEFLGENVGKIVDRTAYSIKRARILLRLGRMESAEWAYDILLEENSDNYDHIRSAVKARGADLDAATDEGRANALKVLDLLTTKYPRSLAIRRIALDVATGDEFRSRAAKYLTDALSKGVPSIFADIKALYSDVEKCQAIGQLVEKFLASLKSSSTFGAVTKAEVEQDDDTVEAPSAFLWTLYFLASHYSQVGDQEKALQVLDEATAHTPSLPELDQLRARILKRAGDIHAATDAMEQARLLDGQDRFLNCKHAKYLIRAGRLDDAEQIAGLFTKADAASPLEDLVDMQCLWFLHEEGDAYAKTGQNALALKRYHQIFDIFRDLEDDQWDFHSYCLRKSTLDAYANLLTYEDTLRAHPRYVAAARGAVKIYVKLHDDPTSANVSDEMIKAAEATKAQLEATRQKQIDEAKAKKAKAAAEASEAAKKAKKGKNKEEKKKEAVVEEDDEDVNLPPVDKDPHGIELLKTSAPLEAAAKFVRPLEKAAPRSIETWRLSFEVELRRGKYALALKALRNLIPLDPTRCHAHPLVVRFLADRASWPRELSDSFETALKDDLTRAGYTFASLDAASLTSSLLQASPQTARHLLSAAAGHAALGQVEEVESLAFQLVRPDAAKTIGRVTVDDLVEALETLRSVKSARQGEFVTQAHARFPRATTFKSAEQLEQEAKERHQQHQASIPQQQIE